MELFSSSMRKLWKEWNLRVTVLLSLTLQILLITLGSRRKHNHKLWISIVVWCVYLSADIVATFALGIITNNVSDIYDEECGSMDANTELTAFWAPFLLLHLGGPDTITAYALEDNELWLRHFLGLVVQTGMAIYVFIMAWTGSHLSILYLLMFVAGIIKYGERTWVLRKASIETIRESIVNDGINLAIPGQTGFSRNVFTLFEAYCLVLVYFRPIFLNVKVPLIARTTASISTSSEKIFKIIEEALGFMYDNLYTKAPLLYTCRGLGLRVITFFLTSSALVLFRVVVIHDKRKFSNTNVTITFILLVGAIILELYSAVLILSSDRFLVWSFMNGNCSTVKVPGCFLTQKRWSNNMSQFSLLSFIIREKPLPCPNILNRLRLDKQLEKQWYVADMEINNNLKTLIFLYLQEKAIVRRSRIPPSDDNIPVGHMGLNLTEELEKSILAWHVATDIRYELDGEDIKRHGHAFELHCRLICQISRYMFYLMVLHPNMISDGSMDQITLPSILWAARSLKFTSKFEACQRFNELLTDSETYLYRLRLVLEGENDNENDIKIFLKNRLPELLRKLSQQAPEERWKIISWTWLEMLPYAAIKCRGIQHAQHLKNGGEFLTHVWFLVTVIFDFTHKDFTSHPSADPILFNSIMPLLNRPYLFEIGYKSASLRKFLAIET
ncbi:hypothetical protein Dsin_014098 [Dipteronia sinensis]|uniref:DUF4220 domain-containing protein n=1 Tax=Dipteronia sinensis TaxID=43782 RepID=A0AAE0ALN9_9ROSI|nr:hypothetical protein Dsin_014098 [Dipteronia sinensis]